MLGLSPQYCSTEYQAMLKRHGLLISMSAKDNCYDNAVVEPFPDIGVTHIQSKTHAFRLTKIKKFGSAHDCRPPVR